MPITSIVLGNVAPEHAGSASGLLQTTQQLGSAVGIAVIVSVYAAGSARGQFVPGLRGALLTSAAFALEVDGGRSAGGGGEGHERDLFWPERPR